MNNLLAVLFLARDAAHKEHLNTTSLAAHMALGDFYDKVVDLADSLAEAYQGRHPDEKLDIPYLDPESGNITNQLEKYLKAVEGMRQKSIGDDSPLQNIVDEIVAEFLSTLYKLRRFK
jgi:hypothetical protein